VIAVVFVVVIASSDAGGAASVDPAFSWHASHRAIRRQQNTLSETIPPRGRGSSGSIPGTKETPVRRSPSFRQPALATFPSHDFQAPSR
jgi:hypothetical protein